MIPDSEYFSSDRIIEYVQTGYDGDYTLEWALEHDYEAWEKELWVNAKGFESNTDYLIWVSIKYQRVNVFLGDSGSWTLDKCFIVGTGAAESPSPIGVWKTTYKSSWGWQYDNYAVAPVCGFIPNSGYAFHSRLLTPDRTGLYSDAIGYPVSHGCVRMYTEDVNWIYDNIPTDTTVVIY